MTNIHVATIQNADRTFRKQQTASHQIGETIYLDDYPVGTHSVKVFTTYEAAAEYMGVPVADVIAIEAEIQADEAEMYPPIDPAIWDDYVPRN